MHIYVYYKLIPEAEKRVEHVLFSTLVHSVSLAFFDPHLR